MKELEFQKLALELSKQIRNLANNDVFKSLFLANKKSRNFFSGSKEDQNKFSNLSEKQVRAMSNQSFVRIINRSDWRLADILQMDERAFKFFSNPSILDAVENATEANSYLVKFVTEAIDEFDFLAMNLFEDSLNPEILQMIKFNLITLDDFKFNRVAEIYDKYSMPKSAADVKYVESLTKEQRGVLFNPDMGARVKHLVRDGINPYELLSKKGNSPDLDISKEIMQMVLTNRSFMKNEDINNAVLEKGLSADEYSNITRKSVHRIIKEKDSAADNSKDIVAQAAFRERTKHLSLEDRKILTNFKSYQKGESAPAKSADAIINEFIELSKFSKILPGKPEEKMKYVLENTSQRMKEVITRLTSREKDSQAQKENEVQHPDGKLRQARGGPVQQNRSVLGDLANR